MPSPFPGMDPYLEGPNHWSGLHTTLVVALRAVLTPHLPAGYFAEVEQYVWLETDDPAEKRWVRPDGYVGDANGHKPARKAAGGTVTVPGVRVVLPSPKKRGKRYVSVVDKDRKRVVTVIELLSPSDKGVGKDQTHYLTKREEYLAAGINLVEIDLLRSGARPPHGEPSPPDADYYVFVSRADEYPDAEVWPFTLRDAIPVVPVPLGANHPAIPLDIRHALDRAYDDAAYDRRIDYSVPPVPALRPADAEWAAEFLKKRTKKKKK